MKLRTLMQNISHETVQHGDCDAVNAVTIDSRKVTEGCLFVCVRGLRIDRHRFIPDAASDGAVAVIIDEEQDSYPPGLTVLKVEDTRKALSEIAAAFYGYPAEAFRLTGITGTNGKTSTTYFLESVLEAAGRKTGIIGTVGARVGDYTLDIPFETATTPDPPEMHQIFACMREMGTDDVVMEVSSHALTLHKLEGVAFHVGILTNITQDHMDFHGSMEHYRAAKTKLFERCQFGVVNADDESTGAVMAAATSSCTWLTYGIEKECDVRAVHIEYLPEGSSFDVEIDGVTEHFFVPVRGRYNIYNSLAAIGAALAMNLPVEIIQKGIAAIKGVPGRIQSVPNQQDVNVLVDYAHTPDGLVNIISAVRAFTTGRVITLFGCGGEKDTTKRPVMGRIAGELSDYCLITSDNPRSEAPEVIIEAIKEGIKETHCPFETITDRRAAIFRGVEMLQKGDSLIVAGKGHEREQISGDCVIPFDDFTVAKEALNEKMV